MLVRTRFSEAKTLAKQAREKFKDYPEVVVELISRKKPFPPPKSYQKRRGHLWCPYCAKERVFYTDREFRYAGKPVKRCPVCGISSHAYWVLTYNGLWPNVKAILSKKKG